MIVAVQLFAGASEAAGADALEIELPTGATYGDLAGALAAACPALDSLAHAGRFAAGESYVAASQTIDPTADIALIPPVSGG